MQQLQDELLALDQSVQSAAADLRRNRLIGHLDLPFLAAHRRFIGAMQRKAVTLAQRMALVQRQIDEARRALAEAAKQRKILEKLRGKQYQRWLEAQNKKETEQLDEIGMQLAFRNLTEHQQSELAGGNV
jgi:flagellar export protein FliJ